MTTLLGRSETALMVIDIQRGVVADAHNRDAVVANIVHLVDQARHCGTPVVWIQHSDDRLLQGSDEWRYVDELPQADGEQVIHKHYGDSFEDTDLEVLLTTLKVGHLVVAGAQTDACIRFTIHGAFARGYDVTLVSDAHTTSDLTEWGAPPPAQVIAHTNLYWSWQEAPGRAAVTAPAAEVRFATQ